MRETLTFIEREYLSSWVHNLSNSLKTPDIAKTEFSELEFFQIDKKIDKTTAVKISAVFPAI